MATYGGGIIIHNSGSGSHSWSSSNSSPVLFSVPSGMYARLTILHSSSTRPVVVGAIVNYFTNITEVILNSGGVIYFASSSSNSQSILYYNYVIFKNSGV